ncbi:MAG TPA: alpha/beta hydrolase-fold protein [Mycobacteriales bacterium]|nr:alpha/beta hydrolase-fold protein [Mycobacteriales bacterium]
MAIAPTPSPRTVHTVTPLPRHVLHQVGRDGYLESYALGVTLLVVAAVALMSCVAWAIVSRRRGRRLLPRVPKWLVVSAESLGVTLLTIAGVLVMVNNYVGYVPSIHALFDAPGRPLPTSAGSVDRVNASHVVRLHIRDVADGIRTGTTYVYLPPGYYAASNAHRHYPTIYLFHGYPGRPEDWFTAGDVQSTMDLLIREHYVGPMIVVSPTASTGYLDDDECLNAPGHFALENYLAFTVVDRVDHEFRTYRDRAHRAIGGMSSGGFCALNIGLHHLHRFSVILASEPYGDPGLDPLHKLLHDDWALWRADSPAFYIPLMHFDPPVATFLDSGGLDVRTTPIALRLAQQFAARGQEASYRPAPHVHHNWREARMALPYALIFAWQHFGHMPDGGSDAQDAQQVAQILAYARTLPPPRLASTTAYASPSPAAAASPSYAPRPTTTTTTSQPPTASGA